MKLIFSRKGFDSSAGKVPSPIFPDGTLLSLPIPDKQSALTYEEIRWRNLSLGTLVDNLTGSVIKPHYRVHLDPDLRQDALARLEGWKPCLGQVGASQTHLENQGVGVGDIFLFFGLFRDVKLAATGYRFRRDARQRHVLWGWLQIGEVMHLTPDRETPAWMQYHPHFHGDRAENNTLYIARDNLCLANRELDIPGAGTFGQFTPNLQLTAEGENTSVWQLPGWMYPGTTKPPLSYHGTLDSWQLHGDRAILQSAGRGQEFVLDCDHYSETSGWLEDMLAGNPR